MIRVVDHRTIGVFLSPRMHPLSAVGSDVCLASSILKFGLANTPTSLDFLAPRLFFSQVSTDINKSRRPHLWGEDECVPRWYYHTGRAEAPRGGGGARKV